MAVKGVYPVLLRTEVDYRRPAKLSDHLLVRGRLDSIERVRFWMEFEVLNKDASTVFVTCRQSLALIQMPEAKPLRLQTWLAHRQSRNRAPPKPPARALLRKQKLLIRAHWLPKRLMCWRRMFH